MYNATETHTATASLNNGSKTTKKYMYCEQDFYFQHCFWEEFILFWPSHSPPFSLSLSFLSGIALYYADSQQ